MTTEKFLGLINSPWRFRFFMIWKLPAAWFMGIRVHSCDGKQAVVGLPYGWRSQNPFRSTYFAAQCAAAEMSTGLLALVALHGKPAVSMLVTNIEAEFIKKANERLLFTCDQGSEIEATIREAIESGEARIFRAMSVGRLPDGTEAARVRVSWSFKMKSRAH